MYRRKALPPLSHKPREYQLFACRETHRLIETNPDVWHLFSSPTGTGKSIAELLVLTETPDSILITPRVEIIAGMLQKLKVPYETEKDIVDKGSGYGLFTPIRLRNLLASGLLPFNPTLIILDEAHHSLADSWQDIQMYLNGIPVVGFTATPFRGTPKGTEEFRKQWGTITPLLTLKDAVDKGYCSMPEPSMWPMVDDDLIDVTNGEIKVSQAQALIQSKLGSIIHRLSKFYDKRAKMWDRSTMVSVPTTAVAKELTKLLIEAGYPAVCITQESTRTQREKAFRNVVDCDKLLVQIDVISEGVDLQIRRLIDIRPTMSPVKWLQQIGRIMRPVKRCDQCVGWQVSKPCPQCEYAPEYICLCRNLERHGYLMEGMFPPDAIKKAQEAFTDENDQPIFSKRSGSRAVGLEGLGKFVTTPIHLLNGLTAFMYNLIHVDGYKRTEYVALIHPGELEPLYAKKESVRRGTDAETNMPQYDWGKWQAVSGLPDLKGCTSAKPGNLTPGQEQWWKGLGKHAGRGAESVGLNPHKPVNNRNFQILPVLKNLGCRL